jgi:hypothetical protein
MAMAEENGTTVVCEIGAWDAGTSVLLSRVLHPELLVVMDLYVKNRWRLRRAVPAGTTVRVIDGDTSQPGTVRRLRRVLGGRKIDLLLIDGDHSWAGVRQDFLNYRPFVRDAGLIAFHDTCEVTDPRSTSWSGGVPAFWRIIRSIYPAQEFVDAVGQQGMGIGVIHYDPRRSIAPVLAAGSAPPLATPAPERFGNPLAT